MSLRRNLLPFALVAATALAGGPAAAQDEVQANPAPVAVPAQLSPNQTGTTGAEGEPAPADQEALEQRARFVETLSMIDVLLTRQILDAVGVDPEGAALREAVTDETLEMYPRIRAVHALAYYASAENAAFLETLARDVEAPESLRVASVVVVASEGRPEAWDAVDALLADLEDDDSEEVRQAVERGRTRVEVVRGSGMQ